MAMGNLAGDRRCELRTNGSPGFDAGRDRARRGETKPTQETLVATLANDRRRSRADAVRRARDRRDRRRRERARIDPLVRIARRSSCKRVLVTTAGRAGRRVPRSSSGEAGRRTWVLAPTIAIGPPDDANAAAAAVARVREYAWVVFTSRNGVDAFFELLSASGKDARAFGDAKVAAIGPEDRRRL